MDLERFAALPVLGIIRGVSEGAVVPLAEAVAVSGLGAVEITMNTPDAAGLIRKMRAAAAGRFDVGAGTVIDLPSLESAFAAGATFIVSPVIVEDVVARCVADQVPVFPGALTPAEIYRAWQLGATMVKVFPAGVFGPRYMGEIRGPFADIKLLACGGVTAENLRDYVDAGASAVAFGASVFRKDWLAAGDYARIANAISAYVSAYRTQGS